MARLRLLSLAE